MEHNKSIFWFKKDLRTEDNKGLYSALQKSKELIPIYILDRNILQHYETGHKRLGFFYSALRNLDAELKGLGSYLYVIAGQPREVIPHLIKETGADALFTNRSYTDYGKSRDGLVSDICNKLNVYYESCDDAFLVPPAKVEQRKVFTPFYRLWLKKPKSAPLPRIDSISSPKIERRNIEKLIGKPDTVVDRLWPMDLYKRIIADYDYEGYDEVRNYPAQDDTSKLSPYINFGVVSIRELYNKALSHSPEPNTFVSELAWREFWYHISHYFPETMDVEFQEKRRGIEWMNNREWYEAWQGGVTGYPIVDAGMRQLEREGWMHGRVRMIVASFLTKDLLCDWRWGEAHFAGHLIDYDKVVNTGNWQWSASCGADPKPLRIFNPLIQSQKFDSDAEYIRKYIPELENVPVEQIHDPLTYDLGYARPIVDHYEMREAAIEAYNRAKEAGNNGNERVDGVSASGYN